MTGDRATRLRAAPSGGAPWRGRLRVVGTGLEGMAGLTPRGRRLVESARLLVGVERHLDLVEAPGDRRLRWDGRPGALDELLRDRDGESTVLLASGDPNLFGIGATLIERFGAAAVDVEPGVSSLSLALARAGVPAAGAALVSAHGRSLTAAAGIARSSCRAAILTDAANDPAAVARALTAAGVEAEARIVVAERLGSAAERLREGTLAHPPEPPYDALAVVVLDRQSAPGPAVGRPEDGYHHDGTITKAEVRTLCLGRLDLGREDVLWDLGAGSGSVAIEAGSLATAGAVYAVERRPDRAAAIASNVARHRAWNVEVVEADARAAASGLPAPDAVFIGGGGGEVGELVRLAIDGLRRGRGRQPGRLVVAAATLESTIDAASACRALSIEWEVSMLQVSRGRELGGRLGWEALNPVHVLAARVRRA